MGNQSKSKKALIVILIGLVVYVILAGTMGCTRPAQDRNDKKKQTNQTSVNVWLLG